MVFPGILSLDLFGVIIIVAAQGFQCLLPQDFFVHRLLTGSILAHEMMHAWLRLKGFICFKLIYFVF